MPLTPDEIVNYQLKQAVRGYSVKQVDELLDEVADEIERLNAELEEAQRRARDAESRAEEFTETESTLKRTLVTAQRAAEETLEEAQQRAEEILEEARLESERLLTEAENTAADTRRTREADLVDIERRIDDLRERERAYREDLRRAVESQLAELERLDSIAVDSEAEATGEDHGDGFGDEERWGEAEAGDWSDHDEDRRMDGPDYEPEDGDLV
jgi:cell division initiation protein